MPVKTNVMRLLDAKKIPYAVHTYEGGALSGKEVAAQLKENPDQVFKTLVAQGASRAYYVFVIPVEAELDLKKAAKSVGEKNMEMIPQKNLLPLTGYVHGGCSPIGMKKQFKTVLDESAAQQETILFSAGKIGYQVEVTPENLGRMIPYHYDSLTKKETT